MKYLRFGLTLRFTSLVVGLLASVSFAHAFDSFRIFGDSLSDTGNAAILTGGQVPERFTNGPVAVDVLTGFYNQQAVPFLAGGNNYAVGGATALGSETQFDANLPSQVNAYLAGNSLQADPSALHVVVVGSNDLFDAQDIRQTSVAEESSPARQDIRKAAEQRVSDAVASIELQLFKLVLAGAQHVLVGNAPDISLAPRTDVIVDSLKAAADDQQETKRAEKFYTYTSRLAAQFNQELASAVARIETLTGIDIIEWDLAGLLNSQIEDADVLGFTNTEDSCLADLQFPACEGYIFFDAVHPTTAVHQNAGAQLIQLTTP
ncbi:SGNH/GDSL hydrolase family protein [Marinobacter salinisoli]|uniref:SGNH/GDSL hydrolase family protein n=1 Tax=Marinobacter salinisoli TaxID=2769486 RepID=A0ABX7MU05_9GAMM|nr:SGNH/GDSL hydrolase family protein [Marinobacter salinisoli]QSP94925.1 SGNH/GDSL hydrolase family protein [Marinobacter salinisoli]